MTSHFVFPPKTRCWTRRMALLLCIPLFPTLLGLCLARGLRADMPTSALRPGTPVTIGDLQVQLEPPKYDSIPRSGGLPGSIEGWLVVVAVTNKTSEWKSLVVPVGAFHVTTSDGKPHQILETRSLGLSNALLQLQGVQSAKWDLMNKRANGTSGSSGDGFVMLFSPPGKNPNTDAHTARLSDTITSNTWQLELAPGASFRLPLVFDCPKESTPVELSWPKIGTFKL
jgi:hypothetical protein